MRPGNTYFISDLHLGAGYIADRMAHERRITEMLESFAADACHIYLLGDVLDYWFEYRTVVPRGFVRFFGTLAKLADSGIRLTWIIGNHDIWMTDYLRDEIGIEIVDGAVVRDIDGKRFYLAHGDDLGDLLPASFRAIRSVFRNPLCRRLYAAIHPRWTIPFAHRWSSGSRCKNEQSDNAWKGDDVEPAMLFARRYLEKTDSRINYFILGHRHLSVDRIIGRDCRFIILGDCFRQFEYAKWDGERLEIKQFDCK